MSIISYFERRLWDYLWTRPIADGIKETLDHKDELADAERANTARWRDWTYQLQFLLSQTPMIDAPTDRFSFGRAVTPFAYIHPQTISRIADGACAVSHNKPRTTFPPSPTQWIITPLMPQNRVIYSPNLVPGIEKILAS